MHHTRGNRRPVRAALTGLVTLLLALGAVIAPASGASAAYRVVPDRGGVGDGRNGPYGDVARVRALHGEKRLVVRIEQARPRRTADFYNVFVDTDPRDRGPEFFVVWDESQRFGYVRRAGSFPRNESGSALPPRNKVTCGRVPARYVDRTRVAVISVARRCLDDPRSVRVSVRTAQEYGINDWAPAYRRFGGPVRRG